MKIIYLFFIQFFSFIGYSQITERIAGGLQYEVANNNWGENSAAANAVVKALSIDVDSDGNLIIAHRNQGDPYGNRIRKINRHTGIITSIAGCSGNSGNCGGILGGPALDYSNLDPWCVSIDLNNDIYFLDVVNIKKVYKIDALTSSISIVNGSLGIQATYISVLNGEIYYSKNSHQIFKINSAGIHQLIAGTGTPSFAGNNSQATSAMLNSPRDLKVLPNGTVIFVDYGNNRIRKIENGIISTVAGNGNIGPSCNSCDPLTSSFQNLLSIDVDTFGNIYFIDYATIKRIDYCDGLIQNIGGNGLIGSTLSNVNPMNTPITSGGYHGLCVDLIGNVNFITQGSLNSGTTNDNIYRIIPLNVLNNQGGLDYHVCHQDSISTSYSGLNSFDWGYGLGVNPNFLVENNFYLTISEFDSNGCHLFSDEIEVIDVDLPIVISPIDGYTCGEGVVTIGANASLNATFQWYDDINNTQFLYQGDEFVTPFQSQSQTYFAKAFDTIYGCQSDLFSNVNALITPFDSCTYIPDDNFENKLISAQIDDQFNNYVKTSMIETIQILDISNITGASTNIQVSNLEGIQDFALLETLYANENNLDNIDLDMLYDRPHLKHLYLGYNNIEYFNSSNFIGMYPLMSLEIQFNNLTCLNLKNNPTNSLYLLKYFGNPHLACIQVDGNFESWFGIQSNSTPVYWYYGLNQTINTSNIAQFNLSASCYTECDYTYTNYGCTDNNAQNYNPNANFDDGSCQYLNVNEIDTEFFKVIPNPNKGIFEIEFANNFAGNYLQICNIYGEIIYESRNLSKETKINLENISPGIYYLQIDSFPSYKFIKL